MLMRHHSDHYNRDYHRVIVMKFPSYDLKPQDYDLCETHTLTNGLYPTILPTHIYVMDICVYISIFPVSESEFLLYLACSVVCFQWHKLSLDKVYDSIIVRG